MESLHLIQCFLLFAVSRWCKQLPVTVSVVVFINPTITLHLSSVRVATVHSGAAQHLSCVFTGACQFSTIYFVHYLKLWLGLCRILMCSCSLIRVIKDTARISCVTLRAICNLWLGLNEATQNAESFCQVESLVGNFPAAFSGDFHYSVFECASVCICVWVCVCVGGLYNLRKLHTILYHTCLHRASNHNINGKYDVRHFNYCWQINIIWPQYSQDKLGPNSWQHCTRVHQWI